MRIAIFTFALFLNSQALADERGLRFTATDRFFPAVKKIVVVKAGEPGPNAAKHQTIGAIEKYNETLKVPAEGPYDVWWQPKDGLAVRVIGGVKLKDGEVRTIKLDDHLGIVIVRGDKEPRVSLITIAPQDDPGVGEKGHIAIQTAKEFRVDMVVPDGIYSLWITPENGARPRKINDRFRVQAGKSVQLD